MISNIVETKERESTRLYQVELKVTEKDFFSAYDDFDKDSAYDLIKKYLIYKQDDGIPKQIDISYSSKEKMLTITTQLYYPEGSENKYSDPE